LEHKPGTNDTVVVHTLTNGLTLLIEEIPDVQSAAYDLLIPGGIITDAEESIGSSLVLAELMTRGAGAHDPVALSNAFDDLGVSHSEGAAHDRFTLRGSLLAENIDPALALVSDIVRNPHLPEEEIESIQSVLLQDIASLADNPSRRAMVELSRRYYPSPYGRSSLGTKEGILNVTGESLRKEWQKRYLPKGAVLSIAGNVKAESVIESVERSFSGWKGEATEPPPFGELQPHKEYHIEFESSQLQIVLAYPSAKVGHPLYYVAKVANQILSGGMFGRLFVEVREKRGLCYSVFSRHSASKDHGTTLVYAGTTPERAGETLEVIVKELRSLAGSVTEEELSRAKANLKASLIIGEESSASRSASNAVDWWVLNKVRTIDEIMEQIGGVTAASIDEYLSTFPSTSYMSLTLGTRSLTADAEVIEPSI